MISEAIIILVIILILLNLGMYVYRCKEPNISHEEYFDSISKIPKNKINSLNTITITHIDKPLSEPVYKSYVDELIKPEEPTQELSDDPVTNMLNGYFSGTKMPNDVDTNSYDKKRDAMFEIEMEGVESRPGKKSSKQTEDIVYKIEKDGYKSA